MDSHPASPSIQSAPAVDSEIRGLLQWIAQKCVFLHWAPSGDQAERMLSDADYDLALRQPEGFFPRPGAAPRVALQAPMPIPGGTVYDLSFESAFCPLSPLLQRHYREQPVNRLVRGRLWKHQAEDTRGTAVVLHGWGCGSATLNSLPPPPAYLFSRGLNLLVYELPLQGRRSLPHDRWGGFPPPSAHRAHEAIRQAVFELRELGIWLRQHREGSFGAYGFGAGAEVGAIWGALDKLAFCAGALPALATMIDGSVAGALHAHLSWIAARGAAEPRSLALLPAACTDPGSALWANTVVPGGPTPGAHRRELRLALHRFLLRLGLAGPEPLLLNSARVATSPGEVHAD